MEKIKHVLAFCEGKVLDFLELQLPVLHTAWQAALGVLVAGLVMSRSSADAKLAVGAAVATFAAALKAAYLSARS
jgi:hypothetical protein